MKHDLILKTLFGFIACLAQAVLSGAIDIDTSNSANANANNEFLAPLGAFPTYALSDHPEFHCGGVLIWPDVVLTQSDCSRAFRTGFMYIGGTDADGTDALEKLPICTMANSPGLPTNALLVFLSNSSRINPSKWNTNPNIPVDGQELTTVGHGRGRRGLLDDSGLKYAKVKVTTNETCLMIPINPSLPARKPDPQFMCIEQGTDFACNGDRGGPVFDENGTVIALTSGVTTECYSLTPAKTRVSFFANWITQAICNHSTVPPTDPLACVLNSTVAMVPSDATNRTVRSDATNRRAPIRKCLTSPCGPGTPYNYSLAYESFAGIYFDPFSLYDRFSRCYVRCTTDPEGFFNEFPYRRFRRRYKYAKCDDFLGFRPL